MYKMGDKKTSKEDELKEKGWNKQNTIGEPRLSELVELYKSLGFEVHLEPIRLDELDDECRRCLALEVKDNKVKTVYTKRKKRVRIREGM